VYAFKNKSLDNFTKDEEGTVTKDFTISEFSPFIRRKSKYFNSSSVHFDVSKKQAVDNPKYKETN
jgi:hypothetical protein